MKIHQFAVLISVISILFVNVAYISGDVLVGSWAGDSVRRYSDSGEYLGDFVESGSGGLNLPDGMDFGADGNLYVSSSISNQILRYNGKTGEFMDAFVDSGLSGPGNLQFGPDGMLYVCDKNTGRVLRFDPQDGSLESVFAEGGGLQNPVGLLWKDGVLYVSDFAGGMIRTFDAESGDFIENFASVPGPLILKQDAGGNILVSSHPLSNILRFDCEGNPLGEFLIGGTVTCPVGYLICEDGQMLVASWQNHRLLKYNANSGEFLSEFSIGFGLLQPNDLLLISSVLLGDVNLDGTVDLLDVTPFVALVTSGQFQAEADTNQDGVIDLLDVAPFVDLLTS